IGMASNGLHSNGFSLVRSVLDEGARAGRFDLRDTPPELHTSLAAAVLAPTRIYVRPVLNLLRDFTLNGLVHITGGGFAGHVPPVVPRGAGARRDTTAL